MKSLLLVLTFLTLNAHAESGAKSFLDCQASQIIGSSNRWEIVSEESFRKAPGKVFTVVILFDEIWVDTSKFKQEDASGQTDETNYSFLQISPYLYDGVRKFETGFNEFESRSAMGIVNYMFRHERVRIGRVDGSFSFRDTFYVSDIASSQWKNFNTSNLRYGYISRTFEGVCKRSAQKQLF